jgi:tetratricopeptide (TPR) repeat protein
MAMGSQQLADDYGQLKDLLELYPNISIIKTDGQPPDHYEIEYRLKGYVKDPDNAVTIEETHRVRISLPFGYPHFAPIAKPLTANFHPDFDPAAIRIADQWQINPSLPDLVLYIGEMISGNVYNLDDPFNQEAAEWYQANRQNLPLDSLAIADIEESDIGLDSLVDDTFASLGLENDTFLEPERAVDPADIQHIRDLLAENRIFTANSLLVDMPQTPHFEDREEIQQTIGKTLRKTDQLFKLAEQLEDMGKLNEALEVADNLLAIAVDAPGAGALRDRIRQSKQLAQSVGSHPQGKEAKKAPTTVQPAAPAEKSQPAKKKGQSQFFSQGVSFKSLVAILLALGVCIGAISLYFKDQNILSHFQANILRSQLLIDNQQFDAARETLAAAQSSLSELTILRYRKSALEDELSALYSTPALQEGLQGRVFFQGEYIPTATAAAINELTVLADQAQMLVSQEKIAEALTLYRQARDHADRHDIDLQQFGIPEQIRALELRLALISAEKAEQVQNWDEAAASYRRALQISEQIIDLGTASEITDRLTAATFRHELDQSRKAFTQSQWQETIQFLEHAQQTITNNPEVVDAKERQDLHRLLINAQLYSILSTARLAYQDKDWERAIDEYQQALNLLVRESDKLQDAVGESMTKIEKTLMLVKVAQLQDKILLAEKNDDLALAINQGKQAIRLIQASRFTSDDDVELILRRIGDKIEADEKQLSLNEKIAWLEENYESIFRTHYPTFQGSRLLQPTARFLKQEDRTFVFTLTCIERSRGSSSKLELDYMFDEKTGTWSIYHNR